MLESPLKTINTHTIAQGQVVWRGSDWLLFKFETDSDVALQNRFGTSLDGLAELAAGIESSSILTTQLRSTLRSLDKNIDPAADTQAMLQSITALVQNGKLQWLPCDAISTAEPLTDSVNTGNTSVNNTAQNEKKTAKKPANPSKTAKTKYTTKPHSSLNRFDDPPCASASQAKQSTDKKTNCRTNQHIDTLGATRDTTQTTTQSTKQSTTRVTKSLIDRFTNEDAVIGEPVSRWLACIGGVPGAEFSASGEKNSSQKIIKKPGKLGSGRISPKNPKRCANQYDISLVSGEELLRQTDFELPGPIPLLWARTYRTSHSKDFGLGIGWTSLLLSRLDLRENEIIYCDGDGREIPFERLAVGNSCRNTIEKLSLYCDDNTVYRIVNPDNSILTFGGTGKRRRLYEIADRLGHAIKLFYSANDRLIQILDSAGRRLKIDYNITDQLRRIYLCDDNGEIANKPLVEYCYNNERDLIKVIDANGNAQEFSYRYHIITKHTSKDGFNTHFEWDEYTIKGKCTRNWGDNNIYNYHFKYDEVNKITRSIDARGNTSEYHYNNLGLITTEIDPEGGVSQYSYDSNGWLLSERNPVGNTTHYSYDPKGLLTRFVDAAGSITQYEYDDAGNLIKTTDPLCQEWEHEYDDRGRVVLTIDPNGHTTQYKYNDNGWLSAITDTLSRTQYFEWNDKGELLSHSDAAGNKTHYVHDELGRITKIIAAGNSTTHYSYDRMNRVIQIIHPNGASVQMQYTPQGNLTQYIDAIGRSTRYKYDGLIQPIERIDPSGQCLFYEYDKQRNLTALINENNERYELEYDKNQRLIKETGFDGRVQQYNYNAGNQLVRYLDGAHRVTSFKRDPMGRLLQKRTSTGEITQYEYDAAGQLSKAYNSHCILHFRYDCYGQLVGEMQNNQRIQHQYNAPGQRTHTTLPNGKTIRYDYENNGMLARVAYSGRVLCKLTHDKFGLETHRTTGELSSQFEYDPLGRLLRQRSVRNQTPLMDRTYRYDKIGNLRQIDDLSINNGKVKFHYNALDRLQKAEGWTEEQFTFDPAGNLLDTQYPEPEGYVQGNRLRVFQNFRFEYDDVGNLVRQFQGKLETRFYYNVANQLVRAHKRNQTIEYSYDPLGRRIKKKDASGEIIYVWDGDCLLLEQRNDRNNTHVIYIHEPGRSHPLLQIRDDRVYYFHTDQYGTPYTITDAAGEAVWKAHYKAYGAIAQSDVETIDNPIRFLGLYFDAETGLLYGRQRYYHPVIGRFTQQNPLDLEDGINNYLLTFATLPIIASPTRLNQRLLTTCFPIGIGTGIGDTASTKWLQGKNASPFGRILTPELIRPARRMGHHIQRYDPHGNTT
jgi:RHS repeat-associated protein